MLYQKDTTELELERRIFGDNDEFLESIHNPDDFAHPEIDAAAGGERDAAHLYEDGLESVQDADVCLPLESLHRIAEF